jgi:hypothetical protein
MADQCLCSGGLAMLVYKDSTKSSMLHRSKIELHEFYSLPSIIRMIKSRRMRSTGHVARMGYKRNACRILVGKPEGERPLGRSRRRRVGNIKMNLRKIGWGGMDWTDLAQGRD